MEIDHKDLLSLNNFISIKQNGNENSQIFENPNLKDLFGAFVISSSNEVAAKEICKRFVTDSKEKGIEKIIFSPEYGYLIDPLDIAKLFIKLGLERDAIFLLEQLQNSNLKNIQNLKRESLNPKR